MEKTIELMNDLIKTEANTDLLDQKLEKVQVLLDDTHEKLEISRSINSNLKKLNDSLDTASSLLSVVRIVPKIGAAANKEYQKLIAQIEKKINSVREIYDKCTVAIKSAA